MIKAVIFDWAGTTVDFGSRAPMGAFVNLFKEYGIEMHGVRWGSISGTILMNYYSFPIFNRNGSRSMEECPHQSMWTRCCKHSPR